VETLVVIPTFNERDNISKLIPELLCQGGGIHVLVVDDNSPDGTGDVVEGMAGINDRVHIIHRPGKMGLGSAYRDGFRIALALGAVKIVQMDADFSHDPKSIPALLNKLDQYDLVIGSRYLNGVSVVNWPIRRLLLSYLANVYTRMITGLDIYDCTSGFKAFRREVIEAVDLDTIRSDGYSFQIEMNYRCAEMNFDTAEVPIIFIDRHAGTSKMSKQIVREAVIMVWKLKLGSILSRVLPSGGKYGGRRMGATL
jgi:dolichol-phosphate mannosyltransferase